MIYFKKKKIKSVLLYLYKIFNSANVYLNIIFKNFKKRKNRVFFGGSIVGDVGGTLIKVKNLNEYFKNCRLNFNILYVLSNSRYLSKNSLKFAKKSRIPIIHNQNGVFYSGWFGDGWEKKNYDMSLQYQIADYVFYQSNFSKNCAKKFLGPREGPGEILYNAVDTKLFSPNKKKLLGSELNILITGKYEDHLYYSLEFAIHVLNALIINKIKAKIEFAGYYDSKVKTKIYNLAKNYNIHEKINFSGVYKQEQANLRYNSADIYFYFVHQSNCPNSVLEAMACGLPILTTNTGGLPELVIDNTGICLKTEKSWERPFTPDISDALNGVKNIINNYSDYSNNCINKIAKDHNINNWIKKHEEIFNKFR